MTHDKVYIYGTHAVTEALTYAPHTLEEIFAAKNFDDAILLMLVKKHAIPFYHKMPQDFDDSAVHQGIVGVVSLSRLTRSYEEFCKNLIVGPDTALVLLGELSDPQNVGAIIRSAAAFGVSGVLMPEHNQAPVTGSVVKVSAGMIFRIPLVSISNVNSAVRKLKELGFWVYGLDGGAKQNITEEKFDAPTLFILGNEEKGIRLKTRELCDVLLSIPINPRCQSLNVAASAAAALYAWSVKHPQALRAAKD
ncbi:MAG: 23S rRNA (guanosine(2251)-2'-O)-methyltransferase RlmB [Candidatus Taylorbacteria bacterium]|nr:23S rRNA (guanosine(2251)-2'-O)-methyltransferase RlmB [Candidatus Taylorbacteria bacterium]